jgi:hypothetical protein
MRSTHSGHEPPCHARGKTIPDGKLSSSHSVPGLRPRTHAPAPVQSGTHHGSHRASPSRSLAGRYRTIQNGRCFAPSPWSRFSRWASDMCGASATTASRAAPRSGRPRRHGPLRLRFCSRPPCDRVRRSRLQGGSVLHADHCANGEHGRLQGHADGGTRGVRGPTGFAGLPGPGGLQGLIGATGPTGLTGLADTNGLTGQERRGGLYGIHRVERHRRSTRM